MSQDRQSEILEYNFDESPNTKFHRFIRNAVGTHHSDASLAWATKALDKRLGKRTVLFLQTDSLPIVYSYWAIKMRDSVDFYASPNSVTKQIRDSLGKPKATMVFFNEPKATPKFPSHRIFEVGQTKSAVKGVASYAMFGIIPSLFTRDPPVLFPSLLHRRVHLHLQTKVI
jgi:hypothetical protein